MITGAWELLWGCGPQASVGWTLKAPLGVGCVSSLTAAVGRNSGTSPLKPFVWKKNTKEKREPLPRLTPQKAGRAQGRQQGTFSRVAISGGRMCLRGKTACELRRSGPQAKVTEAGGQQTEWGLCSHHQSSPRGSLNVLVRARPLLQGGQRRYVFCFVFYKHELFGTLLD